MTRREFLWRSAPLVAAGVVTPSFVSVLASRLFGPKKFWDMGAAHQKGYVYHMDVATIQGGVSTLVRYDEDAELWRIVEWSWVKDPLPGQRFTIAKAAEAEVKELVIETVEGTPIEIRGMYQRSAPENRLMVKNVGDEDLVVGGVKNREVV